MGVDINFTSAILSEEDSQNFESCIDGGIHEPIEDQARGELICSKCGLVLDDHNISLEWSVPRQNSVAPGSAAPSFNEIGSINPHQIGDTYNPKPFEYACPSLTHASKLVRKLNWPDRKTLNAKTEIHRISAHYGIPMNLQNDAIYEFHQMVKSDAFRFHYVQLMAIVALFYQIRNAHLGLTLELLLQGTTYKQNLAWQYYYAMLHELHLERPTLCPEQFLIDICSKLHLNEHILQNAQELLKKATLKSSFGAFDPKGLAGAAIYLVCNVLGDRRSQSQVSKAVGISDITLRSRIKDLTPYVAVQTSPVF